MVSNNTEQISIKFKMHYKHGKNIKAEIYWQKENYLVNFYHLSFSNDLVIVKSRSKTLKRLSTINSKCCYKCRYQLNFNLTNNDSHFTDFYVIFFKLIYYNVLGKKKYYQ